MSPALKYGQQVTALLPKNEEINKILERSKPKLYNHLENLERHRYSVMNKFLKPTRTVIGVGCERATHCSRMFLSEVGLSQVRILEFWMFMLLFVIMFFPRLYIHCTFTPLLQKLSLESVITNNVTKASDYLNLTLP